MLVQMNDRISFSKLLETISKIYHIKDRLNVTSCQAFCHSTLNGFCLDRIARVAGIINTLIYLGLFLHCTALPQGCCCLQGGQESPRQHNASLDT